MKRLRLKKPIVIHPVLFAVFPILSLYATNIAEVSAGQILMPVVFSIVAAFVLWILLSFLLKDRRKAAMVATLFILAFFFYGDFYDLLEKWGPFVPQHAYLLPTVLLVWGYLGYFIWRARRDFRNATAILNAVAVVLILVSLVTIAYHEIGESRSTASLTQGQANETMAAGGSADSLALPDIYYIVLDEYAHPDTMTEYYDYDSSQFVRSLEEDGFFVARQSKVRSPDTAWLIAQVLNMEYLTERREWDEEKGRFIKIASAESGYVGDQLSTEQIYRMYAYNKVADFLKAQGYQYIYFGTPMDTGRWDTFMEDYANLYFNFYETTGSHWVSEFQRILWNTTMLRPFYRHLAGSEYEGYFRRGVLGALERLTEIPALEGPKFVFAHMRLPHSPFVFGADGGYVAPIYSENFEDRRFYRDQYVFISNEIAKVVNALQDKSKNPPIIILQSDHGLRPHHPGIIIGGDEWRKILNAMYLPGLDRTVLYDSISPVNTFRLIFNHYFDTNYALLSDD